MTKTAPSSPLVAERLSDRLAGVLLGQIEEGTLRPGDRLPTERELAQRHGVSRTVVREAVHQLKSRELLRSRQGAGVFVAPLLHRALAFDSSLQASMELVVQVREVRHALEGEIAALAAQRASRMQVATMRGALRELDRRVAAGGDGVEEDLRFHRTIAQATGNPQFGRLLEFLGQYLHEAMRVTRGNEARRGDYMEAVRAEHQAIVDAIAAGDAKTARRRARDHMERGERRLREAGLLPSAPQARKRP